LYTEIGYNEDDTAFDESRWKGGYMSPNNIMPQADDVGIHTDAKTQSVVSAKSRRVSMSAQGTLLWRATESLRSPDERICYDPVASKLMGPFWNWLSRIGFFRRRFIKRFESEDTGIANWIVGRTRYIDDLVKAEIQEGTKQLVMLGAGYDTRAYRLQEIEELVKVLEVDHLSTLKFKVAKVRIAIRSFPRNLVYVPIDFSVHRLEAKLAPEIYDRALRTLFIWEGVTMYLTAEAVDQTLASIAGNSGEGSSVVFDYIFESVVDGTCDLTEAKKLRWTTARMHEPLLFGIREDGIKGFLSSRGFDLVQNLDGKSLKEAYFKGKAQQRKVSPLTAIAVARVRHQ
jgi:methyltransferase (TIGR00027 family)